MRPWKESEASPEQAKAAGLVRVVSEIAPRVIDVSKGWDGVVERVAQPRSPRRRLWVPLAVAATVLAVIGLQRWVPASSRVTTQAPVAAVPVVPAPQRVAAPPAPLETEEEEPAPVAAVREHRPAPKHFLATADAKWSRTSEGALKLDRGQLTFEARPETTRIRTPEVTLVSSHSRFLADVTPAGTHVQVFEGEVAVFAPHSQAIVRAGQSKTFSRDGTPSALDMVPPDLTNEACTQLTSLDERLTCLSEEAQGSGLNAEAALYERAWLLSEDNQPDLASTTLAESISRFPEGPLHPEARVALLKALMQQNRRSEAIAVAKDFLSACPDDPRVPNVESFVYALEWVQSR